MADEEKQTGTETTETQTSANPPEAFTKAMDAIEAEQKAEKAPAGETGSAESEEEIVSEEAGTSEEEGQTAAAEEGAETAENLEDIDPEVLEVCRNYGWDDEKIAQMKELTPELFDDIRDELDEEQKEAEKTVVKEEPKGAEEPKIRELKFNLDPDVVGPEVKTAIDEIANAINSREKAHSESESRLNAERNIAFNNRVDSCFDRHAKDLSAEAKKANLKSPLIDLGDSQRLNRRQREVRKEIFAHAQVTSELRRIPLEKAIAIEINRFKNQDGERAAESRVLGKLEHQRKRFTNPPTRRQAETERKYATDEERIRDLMDRAHQEAGLP